MNRDEFTTELREKLAGLPQDDIDERINFYNEMICDRMEEGMSEEEAISAMGSVDSVAEQIMSEIPLTKLVKEKVLPKRSLRAWEIVLIVLGAPLWIPVGFAFISVVLFIYIVLWAIVFVFYAADLSLAYGLVIGAKGIVSYIEAGSFLGVLFSIGCGVASAGLAILAFFFCAWLTKSVIILTKRIVLGIKESLIGKEA